MQPENFHQGEQTVEQLVKQLFARGWMSAVDYQQLSRIILADNTIDEAERIQINQVFDAVRSGRLKVK
jgi:hypothetical protein